MFFELSKKRIANSVALLMVCLVGDKNSVPLKNEDLAAAICDNITHGLVGIFTWLSVGKSDGLIFYFEITLCGLCASLIDLDHFISSHSWSLKEATSLPHRPPLHCTSGAVFGCGVLIIVSLFFDISWLYRLSWILVAAFLSHHIRDATRRGFWMWPFGSTKPIPYFVYLTLEMLLPHVIFLAISYVAKFKSTRIYDAHDSLPV